MVLGKGQYSTLFHLKQALTPVCAALAVLLASCPMQPPEPENRPPLGGRNEGTWYEIFTGSFYDSNGDGIGDLKGITMKLDYLNDTGTVRHQREIAQHGRCDKSLHVDGIWLTPIMPSPSYHKYDTKDYKAIDPQFGTMDDFRELLDKCHQRGIKLIIDLVMNHSSQDHPWFQEALKEVRSGSPGRYASYYNFYYGSAPPQGQEVHEAVNDRGEKYLVRYYKFWAQAAPNAWWEGSFWTGMPDLNWDSGALREEFEDIVEFWLSAGLDGFRLDATSWPYEFYKYNQMERQYDGFQVDEKNIELWTWFTKTCRKTNDDVYLVGECWLDTGEQIANYYRSGMNFFAFGFTNQNTVEWALNEKQGEGWVNALMWWERAIKNRNSRAISALFLSNHDKARSYLHYGFNGFNGDVKPKMAAALYLMSPGTPFIYYGEEIGLVDFSSNNNPQGVWHDADHRGPMWWSNSNQFGTPVPPDERREWPQKAPLSGQGVEEQLANDNSMLRFYIRLINMKRKYPWLAYGHNFESVNLNNYEVAAFRVTNPDDPGQTLLVVQNVDSGGSKQITLPAAVTWYDFVNANYDNNPANLEGGGAAAGGSAFTVYSYNTYIFREY
jgi:glycosidase